MTMLLPRRRMGHRVPSCFELAPHGRQVRRDGSVGDAQRRRDLGVCHGEQPAHHRDRMLLRRQGLDGPPAPLHRDPRHGLRHECPLTEAGTGPPAAAGNRGRRSLRRNMLIARLPTVVCSQRRRWASRRHRTVDHCLAAAMNADWTRSSARARSPRVRTQAYPNKPGAYRQSSRQVRQHGPPGSCSLLTYASGGGLSRSPPPALAGMAGPPRSSSIPIMAPAAQHSRRAAEPHARPPEPTAQR